MYGGPTAVSVMSNAGSPRSDTATGVSAGVVTSAATKLKSENVLKQSLSRIDTGFA